MKIEKMLVYSPHKQEELANINMAKYRKLQQEMEGAVERADMAENTLGQLRARNRSASVAPESTSSFGISVCFNQSVYLIAFME